MGYTLTKYALGVAADPKMSNAARVVLWALAQHAKDATGRCWVGHAYLAIPLGYGADPHSRAAVRAVTRAIRELLTIGIIEIEREAIRGRKRVYRFTHVPMPDHPPEDDW